MIWPEIVTKVPSGTDPEERRSEIVLVPLKNAVSEWGASIVTDVEGELPTFAPSSDQ